MAHHRRVPDSSRFEGNESTEFAMQSAEALIPAEKHPSREVEKEKQGIRPQEKGKGIFDHKIAGFPWPFFVEMVMLAIGLLVLILKVVGLL